MNMPTAARLPKLPNPAPTGSRGVLCIIAKRLPEKHLLWYAVLVCVMRLLLAAIACVGLGRVASKPATALAGCIEQRMVAPSAPEPPPHPPD